MYTIMTLSAWESGCVLLIIYHKSWAQTTQLLCISKAANMGLEIKSQQESQDTTYVWIMRF